MIDKVEETVVVNLPDDLVSNIIKELIRQRNFINAMPDKKTITIHCGSKDFQIRLEFELSRATY